MRRWPLVLAAAGAALVAAAVALALARGGGRQLAPRGVVQVGGRGPGDLLRTVSTPVLAIDPRDPERVLLGNRIERPRFGCSVFASADGGSTWRASSFPLPPVGERCYAPYVVYGADGRARLLLTMLKGRGNEPAGSFLYELQDGGTSFGRPRRVLPPFSFQSSLAAGPRGLLVLVSLAATEFSRHATFGLGPPPNRIVVRVSRDGGRTFSPPQPVSAPAEALVGGPAVALGPGGEIDVLYWDYGDDVFDYYSFPGRYGGRFRLVLAVSRDGGRSFRRHVVEPAVVPARPFLIYLPALPALAVDPRTGALYAAWDDGGSGSGDVLFRRSLDGGATWSPAQLLFSGRADERTPELAVDRAGRLVAIAYRIAAGGRTETAVRVSHDGGRTFSAAAALTPSPFDARIAPRVPNHGDEIDLGSRLALAAGSRATLAAWADARTGTPDTGKVDVLLARVPGELPRPTALLPAPAPPPAVPSRADRRLRGGCAHGPPLDSRRSPLAVVRSFLSALDAGELRRAYGYLDPHWQRGQAPASAPHLFAPFAAAYRPLTCVRLAAAELYDRSEDGRWATFRVWLAAHRRRGPTRLGIGVFWAHSDTSGAPWSIMGFWTRELPAP